MLSSDNKRYCLIALYIIVYLNKKSAELMITQDVIASVLDAQNREIDKKEEGLRREIIGHIPVIENFASIISGIRRCGKSTLMLQIFRQRKEKALFLNFEDIRLAAFESSDFTRLNAEIEKREIKILFFDEIQNISNWEVFINQKLNEKFLVFITGSNASLLSKELGTHLTGRHLSTELYPFSYGEFLLFKRLDKNVESFNSYFQIGGMPEYVKNNKGAILQQLIDDILYRDIAVRHSIRHVNALRELTVFLVSNIGKQVSARSLTGLFGITATSTIIEYFSYLRDSYVIDFVSRFDYSLKAQNRNPKKVYAIDLGVFHQIKNTFTEDLGRQLENVVYLQLRRNYKDIFYFDKNGECDFVVMDKGKAAHCIQVCYRVDDINMKRELKGLKSAMEFFGLKDGVILTYDQTDIFELEGYTIKLIPTWIFLTSEV